MTASTDSTTTSWRRPGVRGRLMYAVLALALGALVTLLARVRIAGQPNRLPDGPVIVVANHTGFADGVVLALACRRLGRPVRMLATAGVFRAPVVGSLLRLLGFIPVQRGTAQAADALVAAEQALAAGEAVALFPEGRITRDPQLWPEQTRSGAVRLALATGAPLLTVALDGTHQLAGADARPGAVLRRLLACLVNPARVKVSIASPWQLPHDASVSDLNQELTRRLVTQVASLRGMTSPHPDGAPRAAA